MLKVNFGFLVLGLLSFGMFQGALLTTVILTLAALWAYLHYVWWQVEKEGPIASDFYFREKHR